ncbi:MAG: hypothetical protein KME23_14925 [Goleter apudmare HA4340-LM2]|nr:hypothetical protein [Goleter apudmare HA4340-LM2]
MKLFPVSLLIVISAIAMTQSAYANQENLVNTLDESNQAVNLLTEPATINSNWNQAINQTNNSQQTVGSTLLLREQGCKKLNPLDLINNPSAFFEQCQASNNDQILQSSEPVEYLKVPRLDSGLLNLTVTKF